MAALEQAAGDAPVVMDLGDFVPEEYTLKFAIAGHAYEFHYAEATVDEVFRMIGERPMRDAEDLMARRRQIVTAFLSKHIVVGDALAFAEDMKLVPYQRNGAPFDVERLYESLLGRVKKKENGASPASSGPPSG